MTRPCTRRAAAKAVLDRARGGANVSQREITQALIDSGDLPSDAVEQTVREAGTWERRFCGLMKPASWLDALH